MPPLVDYYYLIASQEFDRAILPLPFLMAENTERNEPDLHDVDWRFTNPSN
jgi:hypothetical protein